MSVIVPAAKILPSKKVNQGVASKEDRGMELYPTPPELTTALLKGSDEVPGVVWEPACGLGHMSKPLLESGRKVISTDIIHYGWEGQSGIFNFLQSSGDGWRKMTDAIVTNPPFSLSAQFVRHGLTLAPKVIILNRLAFMEGKGRTDIINKHLTRVYVFIERPPMMHRWMRGIWEPDADGKPVLIEDDGIWREWTGKKAPSAMPVAWYVFEREEKTSPEFITRRISWRHP